MFCTACGYQLGETDRFCPSCGRSTAPGAESSVPPPPFAGGTYSTGSGRLYRSTSDKKIAGVCGGLAAYFSVDSTIVRFVLLALFLAWGIGLLVYIAGWIVMPTDQQIGIAPTPGGFPAA